MSDLSEDPKLIAEREGLDLVLPGPREVFVDLDSRAEIIRFQALHRRAIDALGQAAPVEVKRTTSRNGGAHIYLAFNWDITDVERIAWQACLGSDSMRELLSMLRIQLALPIPPTCFFEVANPEGS